MSYLLTMGKMFPLTLIQSFHLFRILDFIGLSLLTFRGWKMLVIPPWIMASVVSICFRPRFVCFKAPESVQHTWTYFSGPGRFPKNGFYPVERQCFTHPALLVVPDDDSRWESSFGRVLLLKMMNGGSFPPSAVQTSITVKWFFSFPVVLIFTDEDPLVSMVVECGMSNVKGFQSGRPPRSCLSSAA